MTPPNERDTAGSAPDELIDGHTVEELSDYLSAGRTPWNASIENSASCRLYLSALGRLNERAWSALAEDAENDQGRDELWIAGLLDTIKNEVRSGRDIPISDPDPTTRLALTEAAVQGIIRQAADALEGVILGRCVLEGDVADPGARITIAATCAVRYGDSLDERADELRSRIREVLAQHTELDIEAIEITVDDLYRSGEADR